MEHAASTAFMGSYSSSILWLIPFLPAFGALINGATGRRLRNNKLIDCIALGSVGISFLLSVVFFFRLFALEPSQRVITQSLWTWFDLGGAQVLGGISHNVMEWGYRADQLSIAMALLVSGAGFLIHLFSTGYMSEERNDGRYYRFMAYMNLFVFSMLNLVLGDNMMMMFLGWEGVGLCSYLLIGFYFDKETAAVAGKKAFVTNRIGDFGFLIGFFLLFMIFGSVDFNTMMGMTRDVMALPELTLFGVTRASTWWFNLVGISLFIGACGKSAQIPLYVWLPDAMAGPTPVSALIHAATMVTSGLYMICRMNFIYVNAETALAVILAVGALTAFVSATIGFAQYDIKKVLAYSTVSQLGFMFMGMGAGAFSAGMFHVFTHAFFKAALFLGAGSVIVACHHEQDMRNMGGLRKYMPFTFASMGFATLAICGIFPFSGFFSKDEILWKVFEGWYNHGHFDGPCLNLVAWILGMLGAFCTAFYMTRLMVMTFWGNYRGNGEDPHGLRAPAEPDHDHGHADQHHNNDHNEHHEPHAPHEVSWNMWLPVAILAGLAVIGGFLNIPHSLHFLGGSHFSEWLSPLLLQNSAAHASHGAVPAIEYWLQLFALVWAGLAILLALWIYKMDPTWSKARTFVAKLPFLYRWVHNKYFVDEFYEFAIINSCKRLSAQLWAFDAWVVDGMVNGAARISLLAGKFTFWIDARIVDGLVNAVAWSFKQTSLFFRFFQSGRLQHYAFVMFFGFLAFAFWRFLV
ncbi:MAG: NADH-quinone oxidoreductase subunit L [Holophagales bacterium]|jgi:NADH-quinone oxidoreductase subunit L|nr:NADH-quinone oxidoreductase subunit L [Holophagales bacterium]